MEAIDTVMSDEERQECQIKGAAKWRDDPNASSDPFIMMEFINKGIAQAQAELSFKAGEEKGWADAEAHYHIDTG